MLNKTQDEVTAKWKSLDTEHPLVSIKCLAYNHEKYIAQTLDGFLMQETDFPFEVIVHDDASTDKTADIIREYEKKFPLIVKPIYQTENQYCKRDGSLTRAANAPLKGKYIADCEGDDYWTDPYKLQKQVNFLETHPDYGLCHTDFYTTGRRRITPVKEEKDDNYWPSILIKGLRIGTVTVMVRSDIYMNRPRLNVGKGWPIGDLPIWYEIARVSKIKYLPEITATYRIVAESASHSQSLDKVLRYEEKKLEMKRFYAKTYNVEVDERIWEAQSYELIIRFAVRNKMAKVIEKYYTEAKEKDIVSRKMQLYYFASKYSVLEWLLRKVHLL